MRSYRTRNCENPKEYQKEKTGTFWKKSKYIEMITGRSFFLIDKYAENGYRDARVLSDTISKLMITNRYQNKGRGRE